MILWFRRIASCFFLTLAIVVIWMWGRSYFNSDTIARLTGYSQVSAQSLKGIVRGEAYFGSKRFNTYTKPVYQFRTHPSGRGSINYGNGVFGFYWKHYDSKGQHLIEYRFPFWPFAIVVAITTYAVRPKPKLRFGLFDLAMLTTMLAAAIGLTVSLVNSSGLFH